MFADRFANMRWIIATPIGTAAWDKKTLSSARAPEAGKAGRRRARRAVATYYRTIFNPARLKKDAMTKEMPRRYWKNMPETADIPALIAGAQKRVAAMDRDADVAPRYADKARPHEHDPMPKVAYTTARRRGTLHRCPLYKHATQTVFGEGPAKARYLVGEQPGDQEDLAGKPSLARRGNCSIARLTRPASSGRRSTSPTR